MKIAKLWIKIVLAMTLLGYEFELVDDNGNHPKTVPNQNRNSLRQVSLSPGFILSHCIINLSFCLGAYRRSMLYKIQARR